MTVLLRWHRAFTWPERLAILGFVVGAACHAVLLVFR